MVSLESPVMRKETGLPRDNPHKNRGKKWRKFRAVATLPQKWESCKDYTVSTKFTPERAEREHKSSAKMSILVTSIKIRPDVGSYQCRNPDYSKGFTNFFQLYCSDCYTIIYISRTDDWSFI